jgi:Zn ribbon nucleic-acid-binding protein
MGSDRLTPKSNPVAVFLVTAPSVEHPTHMSIGDDDDSRSEVIFLPGVTCPACGGHNVVAEIEINRKPVISCTTCGHTSSITRQPAGRRDAEINPSVASQFAAGAIPPTSDDLDDVGLVHAIDGDGASLCQVVDPGILVPVDSYTWPDVPSEQRCPICSIRMT